MSTTSTRKPIYQPPSLGPAADKLRVGIIGATGMVGQQLVGLLSHHPWFELAMLAASPSSAGKTYEKAVKDRWYMKFPIPEHLGSIHVEDTADIKTLVSDLDLVFCAIDAPNAEVLAVEDAAAREGAFVVSCNSPHRNDPLVPIVVPYVNPQHLNVIPIQRKSKKYSTGAIIVKSNCSIQSYVIPLTPLADFGIKSISVHSEQAISGAGKVLANWPQMQDNVIPFIAGEEKKSETEPLKVWGIVGPYGIVSAAYPRIKARCVRVGVADGHTAYVNVQFGDKDMSLADILEKWSAFNPCQGLPSAAHQPLLYVSQPDRPQPRLDVERDKGMGVTVGHLQKDSDGSFRFTALSHNVVLGAAGGAVLAAELAAQRGFIYHRSATLRSQATGRRANGI